MQVSCPIRFSTHTLILTAVELCCHDVPHHCQSAAARQCEDVCWPCIEELSGKVSVMYRHSRRSTNKACDKDQCKIGRDHWYGPFFFFLADQVVCIGSSPVGNKTKTCGQHHESIGSNHGCNRHTTGRGRRYNYDTRRQHYTETPSIERQAGSSPDDRVHL